MDSSDVPTEYINRKAKWGVSNDIRAFGVDVTPREELAKIAAKMTPDEKERFNRSLQSAYKLGLIARPAAPAADRPSIVPSATPAPARAPTLTAPALTPEQQRLRNEWIRRHPAVLSSPW